MTQDDRMSQDERALERGARETFAVLRDRNVFPYLAGNLVSTTGTWFHTLAQAVLVYRLTESTFLLGVVFFAQFAAVFVLAPWAGSVADRYDRRVVICVTQVAATIVSGGLAALVALGHAEIGVVVAFAAALGVTSAFATPAMMAFVASLVAPHRLPTALALNSVTFNVGRVAGPISAAVVIETLGTSWAFAINASSYLALAAGALLVRPLVAQARPARARLRESVATVLRDRRLAALLYVVAAVNLATDPAVTLGPAFVTELLGHADSLTGLLVGAFGAGAITAAFAIGHRLNGTRRGLSLTLLTACAGAFAFALSPTLPVALASLAVLGFGYLATNTGATSRLQLEVAPSERGRIMALWSIAFVGIRPLGSLVDGAIASWAGIRVASFVMALPALAGACAIVVSTLRAPARVTPR
jgi:MFS family permease